MCLESSTAFWVAAECWAWCQYLRNFPRHYTCFVEDASLGLCREVNLTRVLENDDGPQASGQVLRGGFQVAPPLVSERSKHIVSIGYR